MNEDYHLDPFPLGRVQHIKGDITVSAWIIADLARHFGTLETVRKAFPNDYDPQSQIYLFRQIALLADEIERRDLQPIVNRNRTWSHNTIRDEYGAK